MEVSVLPESDTLSDNIPCLAYGSSHFQQEWPYCLATTQRSYRCKNKLWGTWREEGLLVTGCRGKVVPSSRSNYSSKDMLWRKPPEQCSRGVCGKDIFLGQVGLIQRHMDICKAGVCICAGHLRLSLAPAKILHLGNRSHPGLKEAQWLAGYKYLHIFPSTVLKGASSWCAQMSKGKWDGCEGEGP